MYKSIVLLNEVNDWLQQTVILREKKQISYIGIASKEKRKKVDDIRTTRQNGQQKHWTSEKNQE